MNYDYLTIAFAPNGDTLWTKRYDGRANGVDIPTAICTTPAGNIYVTGISNDTLSTTDFGTVKYDTLGNEIWRRHYDNNQYYDGAFAITSWGWDYVVITGSTGTSFLNYDIATLWYLEDGSVNSWKTSSITGNGLDHPCDIRRSRLGNTIVAGTVDNSATGGGTDVKIISFDTAFNISWTKVIDVSHENDSVSHIAVDSNGNIYIAATWGKSGYRLFGIVKLDAAGNELWRNVRSADYSGGNSSANTISLSRAHDKVFISGSQQSDSLNTDYLTQSYDADGNLLWEKTYDKGALSIDEAKDIREDEDGNVYVTGRTGNQYTTIKYNIWNPMPCDIEPECPEITYRFRNGTITTVGTDTFVEFDIYAKQNINTLPLKSGEIILTYSQIAFGNNIVANNNITLTRGSITNDPAYLLTVVDTAYKSEIRKANQSEFGIYYKDTANVNFYYVSDTFEQLCHLKVKIQSKEIFDIRFDRFFMQDRSYYQNDDKVLYSYVGTGNGLALPATDIDLTYNIANLSTNLVSTIKTVTFDVAITSNIDSRLADAGVTVHYDPTQLNIPNNNSFSFSGLVNTLYSQQNGGQNIYTPTASFDNTAGHFTVLVSYNSTFMGNDPNIYPLNHGTAVRMVTVTMIILDCEDPGLSFLSPEDNEFADPNSSNNPAAYTVNLGAGWHDPLCLHCKTNSGPCDGVNMIATEPLFSKLYPNVFFDNLTLDLTLAERSDVHFDLETTIGEKLREVFWKDLLPGKHSKVCSGLNDLPPGSYVARLWTDKISQRIRLIKE